MTVEELIFNINNKQIQELSAERDALKAVIETHGDTLDTKNKQIRELKEEVDRYKSLYENELVRSSVVGNRILTVIAERDALEAEVKRLREHQKNMYGGQITRMEADGKEITLWRRKALLLRQQNKKLKAEHDQLKAELEALKKAIQDKGGSEHYPTEDAYLGVCRARDKWQAKAERLKAELQAMTARAEALQRDINCHKCYQRKNCRDHNWVFTADEDGMTCDWYLGQKNALEKRFAAETESE